MLIAVQYRTGTFDMVKERLLDKLIAEQKISLFRRESGWVVVARDPVRRELASGQYFMGTERRASTN